MDNDINLKTWAEELGYDTSKDEEFNELWIKLVPPFMKDSWRHITSHVLPARKAEYIRKHCLLYKLELQEKINKEIKLQANVNSLKDYEKLVQIENAEINLAYLNEQINGVTNDILKLSSKLNNACSKQIETEIKEKENLHKCKLIEMKIKSINKASDELKEVSALVDNFIQIRPNTIFMENDSRSDKEVIQFCKTLPKGREIAKLCESLDSLIPPTQSQEIICNGIREEKDKVLQEMQLMLSNKYYEAEVHRSNSEAKMKQIDVIKQRIIKRFEECHNVGNQSKVLEELNKIFDLNTKDIFDTVEANYLINLKNSWDKRDPTKSSQYNILKNNISSLEEEMEKKRNTIALLMCDQNKLITKCINAQKAIIEEPKSVISDLKSNYKLFIDKINYLNIFTQEINQFLKLNEMRKNDSSDERSIISYHSLSESDVKLDKYEVLMNYLKFEEPAANKVAVEDILELECDDEFKTKLKDRLKSITQAVSDFQKLKSAIAVNVEFCKTQPLAEGSRSGSDYQVWRARYEAALKSKRGLDQKIEEDED